MKAIGWEGSYFRNSRDDLIRKKIDGFLGLDTLMVQM